MVTTTSREQSTANPKKSPLMLLPAYFQGAVIEMLRLEEEVPEESVEEEEKGGGTLGAIFRSLNPID